MDGGWARWAFRQRTPLSWKALGVDIGGWHPACSLDRSLTLLVLQRALANQVPEIHHSDQGVQYAATAHTQMLQELGAQLSMAEVGAEWQNSCAERLMPSKRKRLTRRTMRTIMIPCKIGPISR